ncbi:MAG: hypothetical protein ACXVEK_14315 [Nocardioides sp.]
MSAPVEPTWTGLVDDAAVFPPGDSPLPEAVRAYTARRQEWYAALVASFVVTDTAVPDVGDASVPLSVVVTGGAGAVAGALRLARRAGHQVAGLEVALRDLDDLPGNARRVVAAVDAALDEGLLDDATPVYVEVPASASPTSWLAAADVAAERELRLKLRTGGLEAHLFPSATTLTTWIDGALDRETPFKCTAGLHHAVRHTGDTGFEHHGFLNVLLATRRAFDGAGTEEVVATLEERDGATLAAAAGPDLAGARRWFTSFGSCSVQEPLDDLVALGLVTPTTGGTP